MSGDVAALFGRDDDLEVICAFLADAAEGGRALLLTGPAGIGRTALLAASVTTAQAAGALVVRAAGAADEADLPYAGLGQLLAPFDGVVERLDPDHRAVLAVALDHDGRPVDGAALGTAVVAALEAAAGARPLVVAVDDLPMLDVPSARCLHALVRQLSGRRIGLLATARTPVAPVDLPQHRLTPLDDGAAAALLAARAPWLGRTDRDRLVREAGGNPLALRELAACVGRSDRSLPHRPGSAVDPDEGLAREWERAAYADAAVGGDLDGVTALPVGPGGSLWAAAARGHLLLHGDGDLDAAHRLLVDAVEAVGVDPGVEPEAVAAALDTLLMVCRFADRETLWAPARALVARHAARIPPDRIRSVPGAGPVPADLLDPAATVRAGWSLLAVDDVERCAPALRRVLDDGPRDGAAGSAIDATVLLAFDAFAAGRWDEACRLAGQGQALGASSGHEALPMLARAVPALVAACRGDEAACRDHTGRMLGWAAPRGARLVHHHAVHARVLAALGRGDAETAYHDACTVARPGIVEADGPGSRMVVDLVEAAVRTQRHDEAEAHVRAAREAGVAGVSARAALAVTVSAALVVQGDDARSRFEQALAVPGAQRWPFDAARARLAYGEHLRRSRATLAARQQLTAALATFRALGADPWVARAESELRAAGHRVTRARGAVPTVLSHQERTVAGLAATGATNRQIGERLGLSPRTVGSHLTRVFQKLGVTSRAGLADALRAHQG